MVSDVIMECFLSSVYYLSAGSLDERASYRDEILSGEDYDVILSTYVMLLCI